MLTNVKVLEVIGQGIGVEYFSDFDELKRGLSYSLVGSGSSSC